MLNQVAHRVSAMAALMTISLGAGFTAAQTNFQFVDVSGERGIGAFTMAAGLGGGFAASDYDDDGDIDVFVPTDFGPDLLYRNDGTGSFVEHAAAAGLLNNDPNKAALWLDFDGDGLQDLLVTGGDCHAGCGGLSERTLRVYRQHWRDLFTEVTDTCGIEALNLNVAQNHVGGMCAGDVNNDGWLDLFIGVWQGPAYLFMNNQDGTFTNATAASGVAGERPHWQAMMYDFNGDRWQDIYVAVDFGPNALFLNQRDGTFVDVAPAAGLANFMNDMGMALGDHDNDGDLDIYLTNIFDYQGLGEHNVLYRNNTVSGVLSFTDVAVQAKVHNGGWGWGCTFLDADNDGRVDLATTNGFSFRGWVTDTSRFFRNAGGSPVTFTNVSTAVGFADQFWGSGLAAFDADRDGDLDLMQACNVGGPLRLLDNVRSGPVAENGWLVVQPRMRGANRFAVGAVVRIRTDGQQQMRLISAGVSFLNQEPAEAFFGTGTNRGVDVQIEYPNCTRMALLAQPVDGILKVILGDLDASGVVTGMDLAILLANWGPCPGNGQFCPGDLDGNGSVNGMDLANLLAAWG